ncbi:WXG100 family type VII secretion target [Nocardia mexicana]|uniref:ESAT-6-like protein n=2 Tax=Nocardia mexicana TaxID=279262 RepID=A0A370HEA0_9NOCA|nr:WXG100 family type VII secretion target [Nocardia mexicana]
MFGDAVGVQTSGIDKVVSDMETSIQNLRQSVNAVDAACDEVRAGWKGNAHDAFKKTMDDWDAESTELNQRLNALSQAVTSGKKELVSMDDTSF